MKRMIVAFFIGDDGEITGKQTKNQLDPARVNETMNSYAALEHNIAIKVVPLFIKDYVVGRFDAAAKKGVTTSISNMGVIKMPAEVRPFIERFSAFMTAATPSWWTRTAISCIIPTWKAAST